MTAADAATRRALRTEVRRLATLSGRSRTLPATLNVGALAGDRLVLPVPDDLDVGLAADLVTRALDRLDEPTTRSVWITRQGDTALEDGDLLWHAAAVTGLARHGVVGARFHVVTRRGWIEVGSGETCSWGRIRASWRAPAGTDLALPREPDLVDGWPVRP